MDIRYPEWRDYHKSTKFPFVDSATLTTKQGTFLPDTLFLDAALAVIGGGVRQYISKIEIVNDLAKLTFGDAVRKNIATAEFSFLSPQELVVCSDEFGRSAGALVLDVTSASVLQAWEPGVYDFVLAATEFAATCYRPTPEVGFRGFLLDSGEVIAGDIWLIGGEGVALNVTDFQPEPTAEAPEPSQMKVITVNIVGEPLFRRRLCGELFETPRFVRQVVFKHGEDEIVCEPDAYGNISLFAGSSLSSSTVLRIRNTAAGVRVETVGRTIGGTRNG